MLAHTELQEVTFQRRGCGGWTGWSQDSGRDGRCDAEGWPVDGRGRGCGWKMEGCDPGGCGWKMERSDTGLGDGVEGGGK